MTQYFEDIQVGETAEFGSRTLTLDEIVAFAREFDPQPFHIDEAAAARSIYGGIIASGWHTAALVMRMIVDELLGDRGRASLGSPGFDDLAWLKPVRPGDTLSVRSTCIEKTPSRSRDDIGSARFQTEALNQDGDVVMRFNAIGLYRRRPKD